MFVDLEPRDKVATQGASQLGWRLAAEERGNRRRVGRGSTGPPRGDAAFLLAPGQRFPSAGLVFVQSVRHDVGYQSAKVGEQLLSAAFSGESQRHSTTLVDKITSL